MAQNLISDAAAPYHAFMLWVRLAGVRKVAESMWVDRLYHDATLENPDLQMVQQACVDATQAARDLSSCVTGVGIKDDLQNLCDDLKRFSSEYSTRWLSKERITEAERIQKLDPQKKLEYEYPLIKGMGLESLWTSVRTSLKSGAGSLRSHSSGAFDCFMLGMLLASELNPTYMGGQRLKSDQEQLKYLRAGYRDDVERRLRDAGCLCPELRGITPSWTDESTAQDIMDGIKKMHFEVEERLHDKARQAPTNDPADDHSAYIPASRCLDGEIIKTYKRLNAVLKKNPSIRTYKPRINRLMVHAGDLDKWKWEQSDKTWNAAADPTVGGINAVEEAKAKASEAKRKAGPPTSPSISLLNKLDPKNTR